MDQNKKWTKIIKMDQNPKMDQNSKRIEIQYGSK